MWNIVAEDVARVEWEIVTVVTRDAQEVRRQMRISIVDAMRRAIAERFE